MIVYDVTDLQSFNNVETWRSDISRYANEGVHVLLVANKSDAQGRQVSTEEGMNYASSLGLPFCEVSASSGDQIDVAFHKLVGGTLPPSVFCYFLFSKKLTK